MQNIAPVDMEQTDDATTATLNAVKDKLGMLPNLFTTLAHSPVALNSYLQQTDILSKGRLTSRQREMIAIAVAQENACEYCLSAHVAIGKSVGLSDVDVGRACQGRANDSLDNAITTFAKQVVQTRATLSDDVMKVARQDGLDNELITEIIANVSVNVLTNYMNRIAGTEVDFPLTELMAAS